MAGLGPSLIVDDLLSYMAFKRRDCSREELVNSISEFYSERAAMYALQKLVSALPEKKQYLQLKLDGRNGFQTKDNLFESIYEAFALISYEDLPLFVCKNLDNVPFSRTGSSANKSKYRRSSLRNSAAFMKEHNFIKGQISEVFQSLYQLKETVQCLSQMQVSAEEDSKWDDDDEIVSNPDDLSDYGDDFDESEVDYSSGTESNSDMEENADYDDSYMEVRR